jgi:hypothetical protein
MRLPHAFLIVSSLFLAGATPQKQTVEKSGNAEAFLEITPSSTLSLLSVQLRDRVSHRRRVLAPRCFVIPVSIVLLTGSRCSERDPHDVREERRGTQNLRERLSRGGSPITCSTLFAASAGFPSTIAGSKRQRRSASSAE